nr:uncharacterized mitochondrial protein AtMg00810-like [Tanacetum cinerariifolium]
MLLAKQDEAGVILTDEQNDFLFADASRIEEIKVLSANVCLMARFQPVNINFDVGPIYDFAFLSEVQTPSTSYVNPLFGKDNQDQKYLNQPKTINNLIRDDQIDSNIIFDEPTGDVNSSSVENDNNGQESYELEQLARNAYKELPLLKQGDYEMWKLRIKQYFQVQDYDLWDVIENVNSFNPVPRITANADDVKTFFEAIQARFGGNDATKKTQKTLLKQMYKNFNAPSTKSLDSIFNRLQKIVSQLAILGENISQEDLNIKFLRSLLAKWNTHVIVWRNKPDLETMSFNDLYNNFKNFEQEVKRTVVSSSSSGSPNIAFLSSPSSTNEIETINLEQIHEDDLEEMDLKWQLALLSMEQEECFNCHKIRHFVRKCRRPRSQESMPRNQDSSRKIVIVEDTSSKAMVAIDRACFNWSYMCDDEVPTNMTLMAFLDLEVHNSKTYSNTCLKSFETLKNQYDSLRIELNKFEFDLANYKRGLASVEEQLVFYKKKEVVVCDQIVVLKKDASFRESDIIALNLQLENLKKEKESNQIKIANFENASKSLDKLIGSQITYNSKTSLGFTSYNVVAPPPTGLFAPQLLICLVLVLKSSNYLNLKVMDLRNFAPTTVLTKSGIIPISTARHSSSRAATPTIKNMMEDLLLLQAVLKEMCDKKNIVLFIETECLILSLDFKLSDENQVLLKKEKQHKASCKSKLVNSVSQPLQILHMELFRPTFIKIIMGKMYCILVTDDYCRVLVIKPQNKTPYELLIGRAPIISFIRPFGYPFTILNTLDHLGKFDGKADEEFLVGYSINSKAFRVYNSRTKKVEENLHLNFLENKPNVARSGPEWLFDIDSLTNSMNYNPVSAENRTITGLKIHSDVGQKGKEKVSNQEYILLPVLNISLDVPSSNEEVESSPKDDAGKKSIIEPTCVEGGKIDDLECLDQQIKSTNDSKNTTINAAGSSFSHPDSLDDFSKMPNLEETGIFNDAYDDRDEDKVYKVEKALYGLNQAPRAWYETLSNYLLENRFRRGTIDKTLFIQKIKNDILLVQVYVDDIIFGFTKRSLSAEFEQLMHNRFYMSTMRELTFFLGLQVKQRKYGIFLSQDKYVCDILKKLGFSSVKSASTPMETHKPLSKDSDGTDVDVHLYRSMIRSLMYLTSSRPDIIFVVCACSRFQVQPKVSHMHAVKRIFRYLKGHPTLDLWYPKDSPLELIAYSNSDYAGASLDRKSTTGGF